MYAVVVTFTLHPGCMRDFLPAVRANACTALAEEPGCHRFDVLTDRGRVDEVLLYELYTDRAAFDAHLATAAFRSFDALVSDMVAAKDVRCYATVTS